jgi:hypothetical protein
MVRHSLLDGLIGRVRLVMTEMENPRAMAPQLEKLVEQKEDTRALLGNLSAALQSIDRGHVKARLRALLSKIEVDPATLSARIYYAIPAATGDSVASPRGFDANSGTAIVVVSSGQLSGALRACRRQPMLSASRSRWPQ